MNIGEIKNRLMNQAGKFFEEFKDTKTAKLPYLEDDFMGYVGYEDWMVDFIETPDGEPITEEESDRIDSIIKDAWKDFCKSKEGTERFRWNSRLYEIHEGQEIRGMLGGNERIIKIESISSDDNVMVEEFVEDVPDDWDGESELELKSEGYHYMTYGEIGTLLENR